MEALEEMIAKMRDTVSPEFRLFITAQPHPRFPLGLLQMCLKATNEPPSGMQVCSRFFSKLPV
jgi:dynein heavy chain